MRPVVLRSMLFVPADQPVRVAKALAAAADAVIVDLEDAVAPARKAAARDALADLLAAERSKPVYVRVNGMRTAHALQDIAAAVRAEADGLLVPKVESPAEVAALEWALDQLVPAAGRERAVDVILILETAAGIVRAGEIMAAAHRVRRVNFGAGDTARDLALTVGPDEAELATYRATVVAAARAAGLAAPLDSVWADLSDEDGLRASCERGRRMGFAGKLCIHPRQIAPINRAFSPSPDEVTRAETVVAAFAAAEARGDAAISVDGQFVDYPVVERARAVLRLHRALQAGEPS